MPFDEQEFNDALADLGGTPDEVAESLRRLGIKGQRQTAVACPLACWVAEKYSLAVVRHAEVFEAGVELTFETGDGDYDALFVGFASPCRGFVERFDVGNWPDLAVPEKPHANP